MFSIFSKCLYIFFHFAFVPWRTCCLQVRARLPLPSPTSRALTGSLPSSRHILEKKASWMLLQRLSPPRPPSIFQQGTLWDSCLFLPCAGFIDEGLHLLLMRSPHGEHASMVSSASYVRCWHLELLKALKETIWPLDIYLRKMKIFIHIKICTQIS